VANSGGLIGEAFRSAGFCFCGFFLAVFWSRGGFQGTQKATGDSGDFVNGALKRVFVRFGGLIEACDFSHKLERGGAHLVIGDRRIEIEERFNVSAHGHQLAFRGGRIARNAG
jgi:hypothetical protein